MDHGPIGGLTSRGNRKSWISCRFTGPRESEDAPSSTLPVPFFESAVREKLADAVDLDKGQEGTSPTQDEGDTTIFWGDDQGPVVMVWDGMLPGEQERDKTIISGEKDWIIWRVKPAKSEQGEYHCGFD